MPSKYAAMTVNERLAESGLIDEFYKAVEKRDVDRVTAILGQVELTEESIKPIMKQLGL